MVDKKNVVEKKKKVNKTKTYGTLKWNEMHIIENTSLDETK